MSRLSADPPSIPRRPRPRLGPTAVAVLALTLAACGGGGGGGGGPTDPGPVTQTFTGSSTTGATGGCSGDSHTFLAAAGAISVTLVQSSGQLPLATQVCAGGIDNNNCSINLTPIAVGQTVTGQRIGGAGQALVVQPCSPGAGTLPAMVTVTYTATVTYQQ